MLNEAICVQNKTNIERNVEANDNVLFKMCLDWDQAVFEWICELSFKSIVGSEKRISVV